MATILFEDTITSSMFSVTGKACMSEVDKTAVALPPPSVLNNPDPKIIQVDQDTLFTFTWDVSGWLSGFLCGCWQFDVFYELMGPAEASFPIPTATVTSLASGTFQLKVPGGVVDEGVHRIVVRMMLVKNGQPSPVAGFADFGLVQYYKG